MECIMSGNITLSLSEFDSCDKTSSDETTISKGGLTESDPPGEVGPNERVAALTLDANNKRKRVNII